MNAANTTPAQAAGLISFYVHPNDIDKHNDVFYARIYFAPDVDALLQRQNTEFDKFGEAMAYTLNDCWDREHEKDRQIAELVAALKAVKNYEGYYKDAMEDPEISRRVVDLIAQHATPPQAGESNG